MNTLFIKILGTNGRKKNKKQKTKNINNKAKQMRNIKRNYFSHLSASPRNDKQSFAKQCFANETNRCPAGFASRSELFRDSAHGKQNIVKVSSNDKIVDKEKHRHWSLFRTCSDVNVSRIKQCLIPKQRFAKQCFVFVLE